jgi:hypothetical protein
LLPQAVLIRGLQEPSRDNLVGINIIDWQRRNLAANLVDCFHLVIPVFMVKVEGGC